MMTMYDDSMRTIVDIPDKDLEKLSDMCRREGVSRAEIVRRAVRQYVEKHSSRGADAFGLWKDRRVDAIEYLRKLRKEW